MSSRKEIGYEIMEHARTNKSLLRLLQSPEIRSAGSRGTVSIDSIRCEMLFGLVRRPQALKDLCSELQTQGFITEQQSRVLERLSPDS